MQTGRAAGLDDVRHPVHPQVAGRPRQASQVLVQDSQTQARLDYHSFNEAYLMHTSTIAAVRDHRQLRCGGGDDGGPAGTALVEESVSEALDFRRAMRKVDEEFGSSTGGSRSGAGLPLRGRHGLARGLDAACGRALAWFRPVGRRLQHARPDQGHGDHAGPGCGRRLCRLGHPGGVVTKYLAEHGIVVEKTGLYSFFIMFTIGITKGRWNTMVTELQQFKDDYDRNQPLWRVMPEFIAKTPALRKIGLRICACRSTSSTN